MGRSSICALAVRSEVEDKIATIKELLRPSAVESRFISYKPVSMKYIALTLKFYIGKVRIL